MRQLEIFNQSEVRIVLVEPIRIEYLPGLTGLAGEGLVGDVGDDDGEGSVELVMVLITAVVTLVHQWSADQGGNTGHILHHWRPLQHILSWSPRSLTRLINHSDS